MDAFFHSDYPLNISVQNNDLAEVEQLIHDNGADVNEQTQSAEINVGIITDPPDVSCSSTIRLTPLHRAARDGSLAAVKLLVECGGARVNVLSQPCESTPLILAATEGHWEVVMYLLSIEPVVVSHRNALGNTVMHCAFASLDFNAWANGDIEEGSSFWNVLLALHNADPSLIYCSNGAGELPLHLAIAVDEPHLSTLLFETFGNSSQRLDAPTNDGRTLLHLAVVAGCFCQVKWLLEKGCIDVNTGFYLKSCSPTTVLDVRFPSFCSINGTPRLASPLTFVKFLSTLQLFIDHGVTIPTDVAVTMLKRTDIGSWLLKRFLNVLSDAGIDVTDALCLIPKSPTFAPVRNYLLAEGAVWNNTWRQLEVMD